MKLTRWVLFLFAGAGLSLVAQGGGDLQSQASLGAADFVAALVEAGIPAGAELLEGTDVPTTRPVSANRTTANVPLVDVSDAFNRRHTENRAAVEDGVVVIRPALRQAGGLEREVNIPAQRVARVDDALAIVLSSLDPTIPTVNSQVPRVSTSSEPLNADGRRIYSEEMRGPVSIGGARMTLRQALNSLVKQVPGHAWIAVTRNSDAGTTIASVSLLRRQLWRSVFPFNDPSARR